jgi:chromosome partitioning protein
MKVWAIFSQKGGSGKTTAAINLAVTAAQAGKSVTLVDASPQRSAVKWATIRGTGAPEVTASIAPDLPKLLASAERGGTGLVIVDTSPHAARDCVEICRVADFVIVPVRPSILDIMTVRDTLQLIGRAGRLGKCAIVLNGVAQPTEGEDAAEVLAGMAKVLPVWLGERMDFRSALADGKGVTEFAAKSKAAQEVKDLYKAIEAETLAS